MVQYGINRGNGGTRGTGSSTQILESLSSVTNSRIHQENPILRPITPLHIVGIHWVDHFLKRNTGFKKVYIRYQERARAVASEDKELQVDFLWKFANLIRRKGITPDNIWNCDEKGITMGRNSSPTMAIVRAGGLSTAKRMTEGSREFYSILESVNAVGKVLPPYIVWQGKSHRESYYPEAGLLNEGTFAVSESGYMDNELGYE